MSGKPGIEVWDVSSANQLYFNENIEEGLNEILSWQGSLVWTEGDFVILITRDCKKYLVLGVEDGIVCEYLDEDNLEKDVQERIGRL